VWLKIKNQSVIENFWAGFDFFKQDPVENF